MAVVALPATVARAAPVLPATPPSGSAIEAAYRAALNRLPPLGNIVFEYTESRIGPTRVLDEEHRVYRNTDGRERNETVLVNGTALVPAMARIMTRPQWPYDVRRFAIDPAEYSSLFLGPATVAGKRVYHFSTVRTVPGAFAITAVYLDPVRFLPVRVVFEAGGGGCRGNGTIDFAPQGAYWLPIAVNAGCVAADTGATFKEYIRFGGYQFPASIPPDVLQAPAQ